MELLYRLVFPLVLSLVMTVSARPERRKEARELSLLRELVPQLLPNYTTASPPPASSVACSSAWLSCSYRDGCGLALQQYLGACSDLVAGTTSQCDVNCRLALVALLSTTEGERLMQVWRPVTITAN